MKSLIDKLTGLSLVIFFVALHTSPVKAAVFWEQGLRSKTISICFAGNSLAKNPGFANLMKQYIKDFEHVANIKFDFINGGICPAVIPHPLDPARDYYAGDIRVIMPGVTDINPEGFVQGNGCPPDPFWQNPDGSYNGKNDGWGSWSNSPDDLENRRSCIYNLKLGDNGDTAGTPWRNHTLHEIGHALGLAHEHERMDVDPYCTAPKYGGPISSGLMTPYDRDSVMHYEFLSCGIHGNYGHSGLSPWDRLALHILYPEDNRIAEFVGNTVIRLSENLSLKSAWEARGALIYSVATNFQWRLNGTLVGNNPSLDYKVSAPGDYILEYSYFDSLNGIAPRYYYYKGVVRVLNDIDYDRLIAAAGSAQQALFTKTSCSNDVDTDGDGIGDMCDNCTLVINPDQTDSDNDGYGNICDPDFDNNLTVDFADLAFLKSAFFTTDPDADLNGDGKVDFADLSILKSMFFGPPGPSGLAP